MFIVSEIVGPVYLYMYYLNQSVSAIVGSQSFSRASHLIYYSIAIQKVKSLIIFNYAEES